MEEKKLNCSSSLRGSRFLKFSFYIYIYIFSKSIIAKIFVSNEYLSIYLPIRRGRKSSFFLNLAFPWLRSAFFPPRFPYEEPPFPVVYVCVLVIDHWHRCLFLDFPPISLPVFFGRKKERKEKRIGGRFEEKKRDEWETATSTCQNVRASAARETLVNCRFISGHGEKSPPLSYTLTWITNSKRAFGALLKKQNRLQISVEIYPPHFWCVSSERFKNLKCPKRIFAPSGTSFFFSSDCSRD